MFEKTSGTLSHRSLAWRLQEGRRRHASWTAYRYRHGTAGYSSSAANVRLIFFVQTLLWTPRMCLPHRESVLQAIARLESESEYHVVSAAVLEELCKVKEPELPLSCML
jgi:hypothetical protein